MKSVTELAGGELCLSQQLEKHFTNLHIVVRWSCSGSLV